MSWIAIFLLLVVLFLIPLEVSLFLAVLATAIYFWHITLILLGIVLGLLLAFYAIKFAWWLLSEFIGGVFSMSKDFGWNQKDKKHSDPHVHHVGSEKKKELDDWFNSAPK